MINPFTNWRFGLETGGKGLVLITPHDTNDLTKLIRGISFSTAGTLKVAMLDGTVVTIPSGTLAPGMFHPMFITRVYAIGTTVTNIVGVY